MTHFAADQGNWRADLLLLLVAVIWGFGFVAQRAAMEYVEPFTYNGIRFLLGGVCLIPFSRRKNQCGEPEEETGITPLAAGLSAGLVLFGGAALQQCGIRFTTAGKAGFITGMYVVLVPILALAIGRRTGPGTWLGAFVSLCGLYLLTGRRGLLLGRGDFLVLLSALFWALHVLLLSILTPRIPPLRLARDQFFCCGFLSLAVALPIETTQPGALVAAAVPILFGGIVSVGIGYTLQVVAQQRANPAHAAIILSLETVFAVVGGRLFLGEKPGPGALVGCGLMLTGMIISQIQDHLFRSRPGR